MLLLVLKKKSRSDTKAGAPQSRAQSGSLEQAEMAETKSVTQQDDGDAAGSSVATLASVAAAASEPQLRRVSIRQFASGLSIRRSVAGKKAVNPVVHLATSMLAFLAGCVNAIGVAMFAVSIGNVTGLVTNIAIDLIDDDPIAAVVPLQYFSFLLGSVVSGVLISSRKVGWGTELYGIVLMLVSALIFVGWRTATTSENVAICVLALSMGLQNGMLTKHAHAVVRTTHMTGTTTDIGVIIGHQLGRRLHDLAMREHLFSREGSQHVQREITLRRRRSEWGQMRLLSLLLVSFFCGSLTGFSLYRAWGADALLLPAIAEAAMGSSYFLYFHALKLCPRRHRQLRAPPARSTV